MCLQDRERLIFFILINSISINLLNSLDNHILDTIQIFLNLIFISLKILNKESNVRKYKWIICSTLFVSLVLAENFENNKYMDWKDYNLNKEFTVLITIDDLNKNKDDNLFLRAILLKSNKFLCLDRGDKIYLSKKIKLRKEKVYEVKFLLLDLYERNSLIYINNYSIINKTVFSHRLNSENFRRQEFFENECNSFSWSMVTGDSSVLNNAQKENFRRTGTAHLFAVSGLHMGFVFLLSRLFSVFFNNHTLTIFLSLSVCFCYGILVGFPDSTVRAFLMVVAYEFSVLSKIKTKPIYIFCIVFAIILLFMGSLYSISLQLSFTIVLFILFALNENNSENHGFCFTKRIFTYFLICISASCGSFFIVLDKFGYLSFFSPFVNFFINPIILIIFLLSIMNIILFYYFDSVFIFTAIDFLYSILFDFITIFYELEISFLKEKLIIDFPDFLHLVIFFLILWLYFLIPPRVFRLRFITFYFLFTLFVGSLLIILDIG